MKTQWKKRQEQWFLFEKWENSHKRHLKPTQALNLAGAWALVYCTSHPRKKKSPPDTSGIKEMHKALSCLRLSK